MGGESEPQNHTWQETENDDDGYGEALIDKVSSMQEQVDGVRTEAEILRKNRKENTQRDTKTAPSRLTGRPGTA